MRNCLKIIFVVLNPIFFLLLFTSNPNDRNTHINIHFLQVLLMFYSIFGIISLEIFTSPILFFYVFSKLVKKISEIFIALYFLLDS